MVQPLNWAASRSDFSICTKLHRQYGTSYFLASRLFPAPLRLAVDAVYGFVRVPDEWVDNPGVLSVEDRRQLLKDWRDQLRMGYLGEKPEHPVLRAFVQTALTYEIPESEPLCFLDAMEQDLTVTRYSTYQELEQYMRGSAAAVGLMLLPVLGAPLTESRAKGATSLGNAMQLTNFIRDVQEDYSRGRIYLPREHWERFGLVETDFGRPSDLGKMKAYLCSEVERAQALYRAADGEIDQLPAEAQKAVRLARVLYSQILQRVAAKDYDVFQGRIRTSRAEKLRLAAKVYLASSTK